MVGISQHVAEFAVANLGRGEFVFHGITEALCHDKRGGLSAISGVAERLADRLPTFENKLDTCHR